MKANVNLASLPTGRRNGIGGSRTIALNAPGLVFYVVRGKLVMFQVTKFASSEMYTKVQYGNYDCSCLGQLCFVLIHVNNKTLRYTIINPLYSIFRLRHLTVTRSSKCPISMQIIFLIPTLDEIACEMPE